MARRLSGYEAEKLHHDWLDVLTSCRLTSNTVGGRPGNVGANGRRRDGPVSSSEARDAAVIVPGQLKDLPKRDLGPLLQCGQVESQSVRITHEAVAGAERCHACRD